MKDALSSLKTKQVQIEQQISSPDSTSPSRNNGRSNVDEEMAATLRRGDLELIHWLRNQNYDNETILKVRWKSHIYVMIIFTNYK